jgi:hypothetical protein
MAFSPVNFYVLAAARGAFLRPVSDSERKSPCCPMDNASTPTHVASPPVTYFVLTARLARRRLGAFRYRSKSRRANNPYKARP